MNCSNSPRIDPFRRGFALVVTLSLMILLTVIAVGLLTLSAVSLRSSSQGEAAAVARANARLAPDSTSNPVRPPLSVRLRQAVST